MSDNQQAPATPPAPWQQQDAEQQDVEQQDAEQQDAEQQDVEQQDGDDEGLRQTFDRDYVEQLRSKSAGYRLRLREAESTVETLQRALFQERLQRLDLVVDPDAVPYDPALLDNSDALQEHVEQLLESKPYLRKRTVNGDIGQHNSPDGSKPFSLLGAMRANT